MKIGKLKGSIIFAAFYALGLICHSLPLQAAGQERILYLLQSGNLNGALDLYERHKSDLGQHDLEVVQSIGLAIIEQGSRSHDPEIQLLSLFGAGISGNDKAITILEGGIKSDIPPFQLVAINFLTKIQNDYATELLNASMTSNFLPIKLEAAYCLAKNHSPKAPGQIEALMQKVPPEALSVFPQLLAMCGDKSSIRTLQKLLTHPLDKVRREAILAAAKYERDDLLPDLRRLSSHLNAAQQEVCAVALGLLKDESSAERLLKLSQSKTPSVKLAALQALYRLGREGAGEEIEKLAQNEDLFAIFALGEIPGCETTLIDLLKSSQVNVRLNAALALLMQHRPESLPGLAEILIKDNRDLAFAKQHSFGRGLTAWKAVPSARQNYSSNAVSLEVSLHLREEALTLALQLPEKTFLALAHLLFEANQFDLIPVLTQILTNLQSPDAVKLLKYHREKIGSPLIRNYCNLALFRMKEEGPYCDELRQWVAAHHAHGLIQFRPMVPWELRESLNTQYQLTPEDASRLLVESFEALVLTQDENAIEILLNAIKYGNVKNRYALAGLLMRAAN